MYTIVCVRLEIGKYSNRVCLGIMENTLPFVALPNPIGYNLSTSTGTTDCGKSRNLVDKTGGNRQNGKNYGNVLYQLV